MMDHALWKVYISNLSTILVAIPVLVLVWSLFGAAFYRRMRMIGAGLAIVFIAVILYATVFSRGYTDKGIDLIPFSSFERAKLQPEMYRSMLMNVFLFVPLGLALPFVFGGSSAKRLLLTVTVGILLSVAIEAVQYSFSLGLAETDDSICNTLGTAIGTCAYPLSLLWRKLFTKITERKKPDE